MVHFANNYLTHQYITDKNKPPLFPSQQKKESVLGKQNCLCRINDTQINLNRKNILMNLLLRGKQNAGFSPRRHAWKSSRGSLKAQQSSWQSLFSAVSEADTMWEMAVPHTQRRGEQQAVSAASQGGCRGHLPQQPPSRKVLKHLEGPTRALSLGRAGQRNRPRLSLMFCAIPRRCGWLEREQLERSWQMRHPSH